ncbi:phage tail tube protein [Streptomyces sp. NBC_01768]|uniref:phage tail tube protein n=1 Tax=Streptomyces sp. NBC_01768 TaxID=2975938 RepID=UPI002DD8AE44|nr:hypothetical protein [Streptomyces sp. NBC_01768]WSC31788.1 hypothetical protein OG902_36645 [Streptomyces sp. NBC_01768]
MAMSLDDNAPVLPVTGYFYMAPVGTAKPDFTDPEKPGATWLNFGHTSSENLPELGREGDEPETKGSWQRKKLRQSSPDVTYSVKINSIQANADTFQLYYGAGASAVQADGSFRIPASPTPQTKALLMVLVDGENFLPLWAPNVSLIGSDAVALDGTQFVEFSITGTLLGHSTIGGALGDWGILTAVDTTPGP